MRLPRGADRCRGVEAGRRTTRPTGLAFVGATCLILACCPGAIRAADCYDWSRSISLPRTQSAVRGSTCVARDGCAFVAGTSLFVVDIGGVGVPGIFGSVALPAEAKALFLQGHRIYAACGAAGVVEIDVSAPDQPVVLRTYDPLQGIVAITGIGGCLIAADDAAGLHVLDPGAPGPLNASLVMARPTPVLSICEVGGFLAVSEPTSITIFRAGGPTSLTPVATLERATASAASLCSERSALFEVSGRVQMAPGGWEYYFEGELARYVVSNRGSLSRDTSAVTPWMEKQSITVADGIVAAVTTNAETWRPVTLWAAEDLSFLGRLAESPGGAVAIAGGRLVVAGWRLDVLDGLTRRPFPPAQVVHGSAQGDRWSAWGAMHAPPWLLKTTSTSGYEPGYWGGSWNRIEYTLAHAEDPTRPTAISSGVVSWWDSNASEYEPCAWGYLDFVGRAGDRVLVLAGTPCSASVIVADADRVVAAIPVGYHTTPQLGGDALWMVPVPDWMSEPVPPTTVLRHDVGSNQPAAVVGSFDFAGSFRLETPDDDLLLLLRAELIEVYDSSEPSQLVQVSSVEQPESIWAPRAWSGRNLIYAVAGELRVIDFTDPGNPDVRAAVPLPAQPSVLAAEGRRLVLLYSDSVRGVNALQPASLDADGSLALGAVVDMGHRWSSLKLCGQAAYVDDGSHVHAYDLSAPDHPRYIGMAMRGKGNLECTETHIASGHLLTARDCSDLRPPRPVNIEVRETLKPGDGTGYAGPALVPVVVFGGAGFDPATIDAASVRFGPRQAVAVAGPSGEGGKCRPALRGDDGDATDPARFWFEREATGMEASTEPLRLTGRTMSGEEILGITLARPAPPRAVQGSLAVDAAPNPFNPRTTISFRTPTQGSVRLTIRDMRGATVRTLVTDSRPAGDYAVDWDGLDERGGAVASGIYLACLEAGDSRSTIRVALLR